MVIPGDAAFTSDQSRVLVRFPRVASNLDLDEGASLTAEQNACSEEHLETLVLRPILKVLGLGHVHPHGEGQRALRPEQLPLVAAQELGQVPAGVRVRLVTQPRARQQTRNLWPEQAVPAATPALAPPPAQPTGWEWRARPARRASQAGQG